MQGLMTTRGGGARLSGKVSICIIPFCGEGF